MRKHRLLKLAAMTTTAMTTAAVYTLASPFHISRTEYTILTSKLPSDWKILFISDIHYGCVQNKQVVDRKLDELEQEEFDLVILGGDIVQCPVTSKRDMMYIIGRLGELRSKYGIYFVYGNHDAADDGTVFDTPSHNDIYTASDLRYALVNSGITAMDDMCFTVDDNLQLIGRKDMHTNKTCASISELKGDDNRFTICVNHTPAKMQECADAGIDLQLSGHTHGGQVFPINIVLPIKYNMPSYGLKKYGDMSLIVSSGMGIGAYPIRNVHKCEYVVVNIKSTL